jgi:DNA-directed RNA polymerase subunit RPC12/RpoP
MGYYKCGNCGTDVGVLPVNTCPSCGATLANYGREMKRNVYAAAVIVGYTVGALVGKLFTHSENLAFGVGGAIGVVVGVLVVWLIRRRS